MRTGLVIFAALLTLAFTRSAPKAPAKRPAAVPPDATFILGPGSSNAWVKCRRNPRQVSLYYCRVWDEFEGQLWADGDFELRRPFTDRGTGERRYQKATIAPSPFVIERFNGEQLVLAEKYLLVPLAK